MFCLYTIDLYLNKGISEFHVLLQVVIIIISSINSLLLLYHRHYCFSSFEDQGQKTVVAVSSQAGAISVYSLVETA